MLFQFFIHKFFVFNLNDSIPLKNLITILSEYNFICLERKLHYYKYINLNAKKGFLFTHFSSVQIKNSSLVC